MTALAVLDYASVFIFALTGALVASRAQLDLVGFVFVGCLTAVGGGTVRDVILDRGVFWVAEPSFIMVATAAAFCVFFTAHLLESRLKAIFWLDAVALAVAVPAGVAAALGMNALWPVVVIMGVATGCFGGLMRDVVCNEVPLVLKQGELYVTCALAGAASSLALLSLGQPLGLALIGCATVTFGLRAGSLAFGWRLPVYKSRPPRR
ncbi:trimeric intracellular cation channel family protein [Pseudooctadecabacter sp.]|uniref:trimeric intracellular cation channel family protein n=1 Tax=Pseudooctadecabacter sp. TaxID=1966338 RepID=UPI0035C83138